MLRIPAGTPREKAHRETQQALFSSTVLHTNSGNIPIVFQRHGVPAVALFEAAPPSTRESHAPPINRIHHTLFNGLALHRTIRILCLHAFCSFSALPPARMICLLFSTNTDPSGFSVHVPYAAYKSLDNFICPIFMIPPKIHRQFSRNE